MELSQLFKEFTFWHWFIAAALLVILEVFVPGAVFVWLGVAAAITGFVVLFAGEIRWEYQAVIYAVLAVACIVAGRYFVAQRPSATDHPNLNQRARQYVGNDYVLVEPIVNGTGSVNIDDSSWRVHGSDLAAGTRVRIVATDGMSLDVVASEPDGMKDTDG